MEPGRGFQGAKREQTSLLAPLEKRALLFLARHMPAAINSDHLTLAGFVAMFFAGAGYWLARSDPHALWLVIVCLVVNWFGDSLDGTLARVRNRQRPRYGFYVDHITDAFGTSFLLGGLALSSYMSPAIALALLIVYLLLSIQSYLATYALGTFQLSFWKFSPTELRLLLIAGNIALMARGPWSHLAGRTFLLFDVGGAIGVAGMAIMLVASTLRNTMDLYRQERL
jgi:archaetidylinositol phosphate synthase